ncbi:hypothetical protein FPZ43_18575 [Mucilaginibacter pallidiroseus]|uniref:Uncharacterized protein n=1 Tax=Mucilaginibacter pallidiroseus TaxID=2599295 RepID=A0A563TYI4_9SPHI|nr:hypothetical protein [Mucilaginibacter pallidiroseus]TWR24428.1 hypothetical protein FPZ43_18575 [Mucilaginibacter pallidiroseus]
MNEAFVIQVTWQGHEKEYKARFERWGYTHRISVLIDETVVIFEPDEAGDYRALSFDNKAEISLELLRALSVRIAQLST